MSVHLLKRQEPRQQGTEDIRFGIDRERILIPNEEAKTVTISRIAARAVWPGRGSTLSDQDKPMMMFWEMFEMLHQAVRIPSIKKIVPYVALDILPPGTPFVAKGRYNDKVDRRVEAQLRKLHERFRSPDLPRLEDHTIFSSGAGVALGIFKVSRSDKGRDWEFSHRQFSYGHLAALAALVLGDPAVVEFAQRRRRHLRTLLLPRVERKAFDGITPVQMPAGMEPGKDDAYKFEAKVLQQHVVTLPKQIRSVSAMPVFTEVSPAVDAPAATRHVLGPTLGKTQVLACSYDDKVIAGVRDGDRQQWLVLAYTPEMMDQDDAGHVWATNPLEYLAALYQRQLVSCIGGIRQIEPWKTLIDAKLEGIVPSQRSCDPIPCSPGERRLIGGKGLRLSGSKTIETASNLERTGATTAKVSPEEAAILTIMCIGSGVAQRDFPDLYDARAAQWMRANLTGLRS